jgi:GT2 family glycosyltransferase
MDLSIIIVNYYVYEDVRVCNESINKFLEKLTFEIIIIDNESTDKSYI